MSIEHQILLSLSLFPFLLIQVNRTRNRRCLSPIDEQRGISLCFGKCFCTGKNLASEHRIAAVSSDLHCSSVTQFIADCLTDVLCQNETFDLQIPWYIEEVLLGDESNPLSSPILFDQIKIQLNRFSGGPGQCSSNSIKPTLSSSIRSGMNVNMWQLVVNQNEHWRRELDQASMDISSSSTLGERSRRSDGSQVTIVFQVVHSVDESFEYLWRWSERRRCSNLSQSQKTQFLTQLTQKETTIAEEFDALAHVESSRREQRDP